MGIQRRLGTTYTHSWTAVCFRELQEAMKNGATSNIGRSRLTRDYRTGDRLASSNAGEQPTINGPRRLIWSSCKPDDWEILVYNRGEIWEACFFRWPIHHEHVSGPSFAYVRQRAEQTICVLEATGLKTAEWRQTIGCERIPGSGM